MTTLPERDTLFLARPGFHDAGDGPFYCGDSLPVEGLLSLYPELRDHIDVRLVPFARPRREVITLVGEDHQSLPVLVLGKGQAAPDIDTRRQGDVYFIDQQSDIRRYLSLRYGVAEQR